MEPVDSVSSTAAISQSQLEIGDGGGTGATSSAAGYHMRWSRLVKSVEVRDSAAGLVYSSIAEADNEETDSPDSPASNNNNSNSSSKTGPVIKIILNQVSGYAEPGQVVALMGPSGSGKTTLLNTLSGRSSYESGVISINGEPITASSMKRLMSRIAYVKQADVFFEQLTVRDQLTYTALLRLPATMRSTEKHAEVKRIIKLLRLGKVADSCIRLLSGGEKKRVNIGTELLTDPKVLLCDEPISGLDSTTAFSLLEILHKLARDYGKTVITSIHQPSSPVFRSFDRLIMLAEGHVVYFGTPADSLVYLRDRELPCPDGYNAADHWMDLLVNDTVIKEAGTDRSSIFVPNWKAAHNNANGKENGTANDDSPSSNATPLRQLIEAWDNEAVAEQMDVALRKEVSNRNLAASSSSPLSKENKYSTSWLTQFGILMHRSLKNSRSAIFTPINFIKSVALGVITGMLWFQLGNTEATVKDRSSYFFFTMTYWVIDSAYDSLLAFPSERDVILKERASASYHLSAYFLAKTTSETPVRLSLPITYMIISYWMAGVNPRFVIFLGSVGCTLMSVLAGDSLGLLVGASVYDIESALAVMTVMILSLMLLGGFFVSSTPSWISWAKYASPFKYAFDASRQLAFDRAVPCDGSGVLQDYCNVPGTKSVSAQDVISFLGVTESVGFNVALLFVIIIVPRYIAYLALRSQKASDRS